MDIYPKPGTMLDPEDAEVAITETSTVALVPRVLTV